MREIFFFFFFLRKEPTHVEDFKSSNIQDTDELDTFLTGLQSLVDTLDQPLEETIEDGLSHGTDRVRDLRATKKKKKF